MSKKALDEGRFETYEKRITEVLEILGIKTDNLMNIEKSFPFNFDTDDENKNEIVTPTT